MPFYFYNIFFLYSAGFSHFSSLSFKGDFLGHLGLNHTLSPLHNSLSRASQDVLGEGPCSTVQQVADAAALCVNLFTTQVKASQKRSFIAPFLCHCWHPGHWCHSTASDGTERSDGTGCIILPCRDTWDSVGVTSGQVEELHKCDSACAEHYWLVRLCTALSYSYLRYSCLVWYTVFVFSVSGVMV